MSQCWHYELRESRSIYALLLHGAEWKWGGSGFCVDVRWVRWARMLSWSEVSQYDKWKYYPWDSTCNYFQSIWHCWCPGRQTAGMSDDKQALRKPKDNTTLCPICGTEKVIDKSHATSVVPGAHEDSSGSRWIYQAMDRPVIEVNEFINQ